MSNTKFVQILKKILLIAVVAILKSMTKLIIIARKLK